MIKVIYIPNDFDAEDIFDHEPLGSCRYFLENIKSTDEIFNNCDGGIWYDFMALSRRYTKEEYEIEECDTSDDENDLRDSSQFVLAQTILFMHSLLFKDSKKIDSASCYFNQTEYENIPCCVSDYNNEYTVDIHIFLNDLFEHFGAVILEEGEDKYIYLNEKYKDIFNLDMLGKELELYRGFDNIKTVDAKSDNQNIVLTERVKNAIVDIIEL